MVENYLCATGFYHVSRIGVIRGFYLMLAALVERWRPETHTFVLPVGEVIVTLEDVAHIFGLPIDGEPLGWVRRIRDIEPLDTKESIRRYLGAACLAHLYRALCRASRYDTKELDGPLNLLFVWTWERMPCLAPVPRQTLPPAEIPVARSHSERTTAWLSKTVDTFKHDIDYVQEFEWRPYDGLIVPDELHPHLEAARDIPLDQHCIVLRGVQLHDWTVLHGPWIAEWANRRHSRLRDLHPLPTRDFFPTVEYRNWYVRSYEHLLRLTGHGSHHTQDSYHSHHSHYSQYSDKGQSGQHHDPIVTVPFGYDWFDFSSDGHGDQQLQHWTNAGLGGWSDFSGIPSSSVSADPYRASVDMAHGLRGRTSDHTFGSASCDSSFIQRQRVYAVVDTFNPGRSAPAEAGGSAALTDAGGSAASTEVGGSGPPGMNDSVRGHPYDLWTERNSPDRYTPSQFDLGIMGKGLNYLVGKK
ncbi:hypothetical protein AHAS_Ahas09G0069900 [Arachis hypogaea]